MYWSAVLVLALAGPTEGSTQVALSPAKGSYASYTEAWHAAHDAERPLLVILNPPQQEAAESGISEQNLLEDKALQPLLNDYVLAVIDTGTAHGKVVHELFDSAPLPRIVVIDKKQKHQIFRTSEKLSIGRLAKVLSDHKGGIAPGRPALNWTQPYTGGPSNCTSCQRGWSF